MTHEERIAAVYRAEPKPPQAHELGGGIYYTCYWLACGETLYRWQNYCPVCGKKIDWEVIDDAKIFQNRRGGIQTRL